MTDAEVRLTARAIADEHLVSLLAFALMTSGMTLGQILAGVLAARHPNSSESAELDLLSVVQGWCTKEKERVERIDRTK